MAEQNEIVAKAKAEAEAIKDTRKSEADEIVAKAKAEAEAIISAARGEAADVAYKSVSKKAVIASYNKGMNHLKLAEKYFGSRSEESVAKIRGLIDEHFGLIDEIGADVEIY